MRKTCIIITPVIIKSAVQALVENRDAEYLCGRRAFSGAQTILGITESKYAAIHKAMLGFLFTELFFTCLKCIKYTVLEQLDVVFGSCWWGCWWWSVFALGSSQLHWRRNYFCVAHSCLFWATLWAALVSFLCKIKLIALTWLAKVVEMLHQRENQGIFTAHVFIYKWLLWWLTFFG